MNSFISIWTEYAILTRLASARELEESLLQTQVRELLAPQGIRPDYTCCGSTTFEGYMLNRFGPEGVEVRKGFTHEHDDGEPRRHGPWPQRIYAVFCADDRLALLCQQHPFLPRPKVMTGV